MGILEVTGVSLNFGGVQALSNVNFTVKKGEIFSIIGPNGAGKTTLLNCISGRYPPAGSIRMNGVEMVGMKAHARPGLGIARTFQNIALFAQENVLDNVLVGRNHLLHAGIMSSSLFWTRWGCLGEEAEANGAAVKALAALGLEGVINRPVADLPYGVQKRVELARAMVAEPKLLLLDEPMAGMTLNEKLELAGHIQKLNSAHDVTVLMIEHDMGIVMSVSHRVMVLDFGEKIAEGTPGEVMENTRVRKAYLGEEIS